MDSLVSVAQQRLERVLSILELGVDCMASARDNGNDGTKLSSQENERRFGENA